MIVPAMNAKELVIEVLKDYPTVIKKASYLTRSCRRAAIKSKDKHVHKVFEYKSRLKNDWLIRVDYYVGHPECSAILYYRDHYGMNGIELINQEEQTIFHYCSHFFRRYNERFLKQEGISKKELFERFVCQNPRGIMLNVPDSDEWKNRIFSKFRQGIGLGYVEVVEGTEYTIYYFRTFISNDMASESQADYFDLTTKEFEAYWGETNKYKKGIVD